MRPHGAHHQEGGALQPKTDSGEAVLADPPLFIPPEKSAGILIFLPQSDLQVHLYDAGLQSETKAAEAEDGPQQINLEVWSRLQLAVQRGPVVRCGTIEHDPTLPLVA
ncbi:hypothetical protein T07_13202 [Trichinella nelsoni]|uniref:Uncharacterized protein n=1 Tax=Trichinella nelsoni TaxID=6336 RepID=A0A0V0RVK3_9BILA|nr:hypothetical protein T07_13202 [Trichinella nelsoni]